MCDLAVEAREPSAGLPPSMDDALKNLAPSLLALALARLAHPADAEDAVQETFVRVLKNLPDYRPEAPFDHWVFTVAANVIRNMLRSRRVRETSPLPQDPPALEPEGESEATGSLEQVLSAMKGLEPDEVAPLLLHYVHGVPQREVAAHLGLPVEHLRVRFYRTLQKIRRAVKE